MKIQNEPTNAHLTANVDAASKLSPKNRVSGADGDADGGITDTVDISGIAARLAADPARLEQLREAVQSGTYRVSAEDISARILAEHLDNSNTRS